MECSTTWAKLGRLGAGPVLDPTLESSRAPHQHTNSNPPSVSVGDLHRAREQKCECTRLSSVHGPSSASPGGQGQPQTDPARHFCKPVHFSDLRERWAPAFSKAFLSFQ